MENYIFRLERLGFAAHEAYRTCEDFMRCFGVQNLEEYISELESDYYVDPISA